jgi:chorismate mutase/prephenate dehydratase
VNIDDFRQRIDAIDDQILDLLDERAKVAQEIATVKRASAVAIHDPEREQAIYERLTQRVASRPDAAFPESAVKPVFREIMSACLATQQSLSVAYLGPSGTFSHMAARNVFGLAVTYQEAQTISGVFDAVQRGSVDYGIAPIENSTEGGVSSTLEGLLEHDVMIRGEVVLDVTQCLLARHADIGKIQRVYSHPQALAQCRAWLARNLPSAQLISYPSTSGAAREAAADDTAAAIASRLAAELSGLQILRDSVQDRQENATRFVIVGATDAPRTGRDKTSLVFSTPHQQGALRQVLEIFDGEAINLTRIESRPANGKRWEYVFFVDLEGHRADAAVQRALEALRQKCSMVKVLGSYPRSG